MDVINYLELFAFIVNLFILLLVSFRSKKTPANISLLILSFATTAWCFATVFFRTADASTVLIWAKLLYFSPIFIPSGFLLLALYFPNNKINSKTLNFIVLTTFLITSLTLLPDVLIKKVIFLPGEEKEVLFGWAYYLYMVYYLAFFSSSYVIFLKKYFQASIYTKMQILYIFLGLLLTSIPGMITNLILPALGVFAFNWVAQVLTIIWISCLAYAIIKHRLLDIRFVVARTITYIVLVILLGFFYALSVFIFANLFFQETTAPQYTYLSTVLALFIAFSVQPLKNFLESITDKIFFKGRYSSNELVLRLTQIMASTLHQDALTKNTLDQLLVTMRINRGAFILFEHPHQIQIIAQGDGVKESHYEIFKKLFALKRVVILEEEADEKIKQMMRDCNIVVAIPLFEDNHDEGLLVLGEKKSGEIYSQQDVEVLEIFGPEVAVALHNAESYEAISKFNSTLKKEIAMATKDLTEANEKLKQLDKLKDEFVSVASHELRTPMAAIKSYLWMALQGKGGKLNEKQKYYVERGYNSVGRLVSLVNDMLNISRIESGRITIVMKSVDLVTLTQEVIDEILPRAQELGITMTLRKPRSLPCVLADADKIKEVLFNLIGNSLKFTPKGGTITITFSHANGVVETKIVDTGSGIEPDDIGKLFQKFGLISGSYTTNQPAMGTGLGLYICRSILDLHHGKIKAASEGRGKGATFTFTLHECTKADTQALSSSTTDSTKEKVALIHTQF